MAQPYPGRLEELIDDQKLLMLFFALERNVALLGTHIPANKLYEQGQLHKLMNCFHQFRVRLADRLLLYPRMGPDALACFEPYSLPAVPPAKKKKFADDAAAAATAILDGVPERGEK